jgi:predicted MFS family arabinose efflux permease
VKRYIDSYRGLPRGVWVLALVVLVNRAGSMVLPFMSLYMTNKLGADPESTGRALTIYGIGAVIGVSLGGWLVDRLNKRAVMVCSLVSNGAGFFIMSELRNFTVLTIALFVVGIVGEAFRPANAAAVVSVAPPERLQRAFALHALAANLGLSVGATLGGSLAAISYTALFYVDGVTCFAAATLLLLVVGPMASAPRDKTLDRASSTVFIRLGGFMIAFAIMAVLFIQFFTTATLYHNEVNHFSEARIGYLLAVNTLGITFLQMPVTTRTQTLNRPRLIAFGCLMFAGGFALLPFSSLYSIAVASSIIWTAGEMVALPTINAYVVAIAPSHLVGRYLGATSAAFTVGRMVAPLIGTIVFQRLGGNVLWWASAAIAVALALYYYAMADRDTV